MSLRKRFCLYFLIAITFFGCRKNTNANWDVDVVVPVLNSVLNIKNFTADTIFKADNTGLLHLIINREVGAIKLDSLIDIPDSTYISPFKNEFFDYTLDPGKDIALDPVEIKFNFGTGTMLKRADIRQGIIHVKFSNHIGEPLDLTYVLPTVTRDGQPLTITESIPPGVNSLLKSYDLAGYSMNLRGKNGNDYNTIVQNYTMSLNPNANKVLIKVGPVADLEVSFSDAVPQFVEGYFGQQTIKIAADTAQLNLAKNLKASNFMLSEASMIFNIVNEFGVEFSGSISNVKAINKLSNKTVVLNSSKLSSININRAKRSGDVITPDKKVIDFTTSNSNITSFISNLPDQITYQGSIKMNPLGNISGYNDFAYYNTGVRIIADIDIPLRFSADYFELTSNSALDLSKTSQLDDVNGGRFVVNASNGFPFSAQVQAYMYDEQNNLLDSIFVAGSNIMERGVLNSVNEVTAPTKSKVYIPISKAKIANLKKCRTVKILSRFIMPPTPPDIKLLEKYELGITVVAELSYNIALNTN